MIARPPNEMVPDPQLVDSIIYIADAGSCDAGLANGRIVRLKITGGNTPDVFTVMFAGLHCPNGIAFDRREVLGVNVDFLYWSDKLDKKIYWTNATNIACGGMNQPACMNANIATFATTTGTPGNVRVCSVNNTRCDNPGIIYWTEHIDPSVNLAGSIQSRDATIAGPGTALVTLLWEPVGLSIGKDKIYWTDKGTNIETMANTIGRADAIGFNSSVEPSFVPGVVGSVGVGVGFEVPFQGGPGEPKAMFWTLTDTEKIRTRDIDDDMGLGSDFGANPGKVTGIRVIFAPGLDRRIPTISTWGAVVMLLLVLAGGTIAFRHLRASTS